MHIQYHACWCPSNAGNQIIRTNGIELLFLEYSDFGTSSPFTLIPAWIGNHMPSKVWYEIIYRFLNFNGATVEVKEWISNFIPHFMMDVIANQCWD